MSAAKQSNEMAMPAKKENPSVVKREEEPWRLEAHGERGGMLQARSLGNVGPRVQAEARRVKTG